MYSKDGKLLTFDRDKSISNGFEKSYLHLVEVRAPPIVLKKKLSENKCKELPNEN
jgi:hypothetical protein